MIKIVPYVPPWKAEGTHSVSLYGPPTQHVYYWQLYGGETREESLRTDLERLEYWRSKLLSQGGHN